MPERDEYDEAFDAWYDELDKFDVVDSMTLKQALRKAYFSGAEMITDKSLAVLQQSRKAK
ncbi:MAG: hypothetical protein ACR2PS_05665 [Pseudomonadales bacterium]